MKSDPARRIQHRVMEDTEDTEHNSLRPPKLCALSSVSSAGNTSKNWTRIEAMNQLRDPTRRTLRFIFPFMERLKTHG